MMRRRARVLRTWLESPVDIASLIVFRVLFGTIMACEMLRYATYGWIERDYVQPAHHFTFYGFDWVKPWPGPLMHLHFAVLLVAAVAVAVGFQTRLNAGLLGLGMAYVFLLEKSNYLNHLYLVTLIGFLMMVPPLSRRWAVDSAREPRERQDWAPRWQLWLIRLQLAIPYVYGGIAKINSDWLVRGEPMRAWLTGAADWPLVGAYATREPVVMFTSWAGCLFDLLIVPAILWRRTRPFAALAALAFHVTNSQLFEIGIFPWMMLAGTSLFFEPSWPRDLLARARRLLGRAELAPLADGRAWEPARARLPAFLVLGYVLVQLILPFRHHLYPHNVMWSEEGQRFSWFMKSHHKECEGRFFARVLPAGSEWEIQPRDYLTERQEHAMLIWPDMIQDFARLAAADLEQKLGQRVAIRAVVTCSLNGCPPRPLTDPAVDLAAQPRTLRPATWILPLE